jgi:ribosomal protein S12
VVSLRDTPSAPHNAKVQQQAISRRQARGAWHQRGAGRAVHHDDLSACPLQRTLCRRRTITQTPRKPNGAPPHPRARSALVMTLAGQLQRP